MSEFGATAYSSFESMKSTLEPSHWGIHGGMAADVCHDQVCQSNGTNPMSERNYPCDSIITVYFGPQQDLNATGAESFKKQLWQCMVGQALFMKQSIEARREMNQFGVIT